MFTGIIEEVGTVRKIGGGTLAIDAAKVIEDVHLGDSIAVNGVCLTVTSFDREHFEADVMPETVRRGDVPFSPLGVLRDFRNVFRNRIFLLGAATLSLSYIPLMSWVAVSPVILMDAGGLTTSEFAWSQVPVFSAVIIANLSVARWVKDPTRPRFVLSAVPVQMLGLAILIVGNLVWPHVWLWSVLGTSLYAFGIGMIFPTLFRFTLFSNNLPKGTVSASLNMVILTVMAVSVEIGRWLWFNGGRISFHLLAVAAGIAVVFTLAGLLKRVRQHEATTLVTEN